MLGGEEVGFFVLIILAPACLEGLLLQVLRKTRDKVGMAGRYPLGLEGLGHLRNEAQQRMAGVDEAFAFAGLFSKGGDVASLLFSSRGAATVDTNAMLWAQFGMPDSLVRNSEPRWEGSAPPSGRRSPSSNFLEQGRDCLKKDERMGGLGQH